MKKKAAEGASEQAPKSKQLGLARKAQLSSSDDNVESGSHQRTVLRSAKKIRIDDDDIDEDELLADSPPPKPAPVADAALTSRTNASKVGDIPAKLFTNRRIVVRSVDSVSNNENNLLHRTTTGTGKGIFDRLDKKVISVNESAKRKIQRIVINNSD